MSRRQQRRVVSSTVLTLQPLEPRCLMAADAGFSAGFAAGPRLSVAQAHAEAAAGSQAAEQAHVRRDVAPAAAVVDVRRQAVAVTRGFGTGITTDPGIANAVTNASTSMSREVSCCNRRNFDHIGNFNATAFGADYSETSNI